MSFVQTNKGENTFRIVFKYTGLKKRHAAEIVYWKINEKILKK